MKHFTLLLLYTIISHFSLAQGFSEKTNAIRLNFKDPISPTTLPEIQWTFPIIEVSYSTEQSIKSEIKIQSDVAIKEIKFKLISGGETKTKVITVTENEFNKRIIQPVVLIEGENILQLEVSNIKGATTTSSRTILFGKENIEDAIDINRKDYALLFATDNYDNWSDLSNPVFDAKSIADVLKNKYNFETEIIQNPTTDEILEKIYDYNNRKFNPQDQLFIFFAGHGSFDETLGEGYIVSSNSLLNDKGRASYISHILLRERINNIKCEHIFLMMDVCYGGTFDPLLAKSRSTEAIDEANDKQYLIKKLTKTTRKYLTSGSKEYVADGIPGKHSPFAEKFILALKEIGGGSGNILTLVELQTYFINLQSEPRFGGFGKDDPASDFVFVLKH